MSETQPLAENQDQRNEEGGEDINHMVKENFPLSEFQ